MNLYGRQGENVDDSDKAPLSSYADKIEEAKDMKRNALRRLGEALPELR